jgi:hypothetical protein
MFITIHLLSNCVLCCGCAASEQQDIGNALLATEVPPAEFISVFCWLDMREIIECLSHQADMICEILY